MSEEIAGRLRRVIAGLPFNKAELADRLEVTPQAVTGWESTGRIGKKSLEGLARVAGTTVEYLLSGKGAVPEPKDPDRAMDHMFRAFGELMESHRALWADYIAMRDRAEAAEAKLADLGE